MQFDNMLGNRRVLLRVVLVQHDEDAVETGEKRVLE